MLNGVKPSSEYNVSTGALKQENIENTIAKSKQAVSDNFESNSAVKVLSSNAGEAEATSDKIKMLAILSIVDGFVDKLIGGSQEKGLLNRFAKIGDSISHLFNLDKIVSKESSGRISNFIKTNRLTKYFTKDFQAISKSPFTQSQSMAEKYAGSLNSVLPKIVSNLQGETAQSIISKYADSLSQETINVLSTLSEETATNDQLIKAFEELTKKGIKIDNGKFNILLNKFKAASSKMGETLLGGKFAKGALKTKDTITYGGGLLSLYFTASALINAIKATKEAPKGEKKSTFMHVMSEQYLGIILFQPSINIMYKLGGNKYRGMTLEARQALKDLVQNTNTNRELTREGLKIAKIQRDLLLKGVAKDKVDDLAGKGIKEVKNLAKSLKKEGAKLPIWEKILKSIGKVCDMGLDTLKKPRYIKLPILGEKNIHPTLKGFAGGLGRAILILLVIQPIIQKPITKLCHKIFGEPRTYLEKQKKKEELTNNASGDSDSVQSDSHTENSHETNLLKIYENGGKQPTTQNQNKSDDSIFPSVDSGVAASDNKTDAQASSPIASSDNQANVSEQSHSQTETPLKEDEQIDALKIKDKKDKNKNRYIPSIEVDNSYMDAQEKEIEKRVNALLKKTDKMVKEGNKYYG